MISRHARIAGATGAALFLVLAAGRPLEAQETDGAMVRTVSLSASQRLAVSLHWGEVRVRGSDRADVRIEIRPERSGRDGLASVGSLEDTSLLIEDGADEVRIHTPEPAAGSFRALDLTVYVPRSVDLYMEMLRGGEIDVEGVDGTIEISSRNGSVRMRGIAGSATVDAANGEIDAAFDEVTPGVPMSFASMNGSVELTLPADTPADLRIRTTGDEILTDFDLVPIPRTGVAPDERPADAPRSKRLDARINGGGPLLLVTTFNGPVVLRRGTSR